MQEGSIIANKDEIVNISTQDLYGASFKISVLQQETGEFILKNADMEEYKDVLNEGDEDLVFEVAKDAQKNRTLVELKDSEDLRVNDVVSLGDHIYRVKSIKNNRVVLHKGLYEDIAKDSEIKLKTNLALYFIKLKIKEPGDYIIRAQDLKYGLDITSVLKVVPKSIETMSKDIKNLSYAILGN